MDESKTSTEEDHKRWAEEDEIEDLAITVKRRVRDKDGKFSEKVPISPKGEIQLMDTEGNLLSYFTHMAMHLGDGNAESLYKLAKKVEEKDPNLQFEFERNYDEGWIKFTVIDEHLAKDKLFGKKS